MSSPQPTRAALVALAAALAAAPPSAGAQLIAPKTVPVAQGDQFEIFPSRRVGMGGASIALADTLRDPFVNPAKSTRLGEMRLFSAPTFYGISDGGGGGRTIPIGSTARFGAWNGTATVALQQLDKGDAVNFTGTQRFSDRTAINHYAAGAIGRRLGARTGPGGWSVGVGAEWAGLNAVDGVNLLYQGSDRIDQAGHMVDVRAGVLRDWEDGRWLELLVVHNRFAMTHDVSWTTWTWDPALRTSRQGQRVDANEDRTNTWGLHLQHARPLGTAGWRVGYVATANRLSHPKIPNYSIMSIPRDPGTTYAYNAGVGIARTVGPATFAADLVYEPMWSTTWADAARDTTGPTGIIIPKGGHTVDNAFRFSNALLRLGVAREATLSGDGRSGVGLGVRAGVSMYSINYDLDQADRVRGARRSQREHWVEWTPTWGVSFRFPELELHYTGRYTTGVGRPGVAGACCAVADAALQALAAAGGGTIIAAPSAPLTLQDVHVLAHQVSFSLPIR
jgi:hypothetical protein